MPDLGRGRAGPQVRRLMAAWLAALIAISALIDAGWTPGLPDPAPDRSAALPSGQQAPVAAPLEGQPAVLGVLTRLPALERLPNPPPPKASLSRAAIEQPALLIERAVAFVDRPVEALDRAAVGTARSPTGPPV